MAANRNKQQRQFLMFAFSGCLLIMVALMCLGTTLLTGLYFYDRYNLPALLQQPTLPVALEQPPVQPEPALEPIASPTLSSPVVELDVWPTATLDMVTPTPAPIALGAGVDPPIALDQQPAPGNAHAYLERLYLADHPAHDYYDSAVRLGKRDIGARTFNRPSFNVGDQHTFQTAEGAVNATLLTVTEHAYFWVDDTLTIPQEALNQAGEELESRFYGPVNQMFGQPWAPGVDGDPRFSILHLAGVDNRYELGFFSDQDEYPRALFQDSNEQEIIYLIMDQLEVGSDLYYGTLVHELQHLFQWNLDKNEATWLNEGLSQLAELYAGLNTVVADPYAEQPEVRLDQWSYDEQLVGAHYAASYLFLAYAWDQLSEAGIYELVRHPANGLIAVSSVLQGFQPDRSLGDFLADWAVATYLDDPRAGERFNYARLDVPTPVVNARVDHVPFSQGHELEQFGVHYIDIAQTGPRTLTFAGDTTARLIDAPPTSGEQMWYALPSNDSDARLTTTFDLRNSNKATLTFNAWVDLEEEYDFAYVSVSTDQGSTWDVLHPQHSQPGNYGPALSGASAESADSTTGWIRETLSLNQYAGQQILLRFQVLTDFETTGRGFAIDDIAVNEIGFFDDVESGTGNWQAEGFARTGWLLPQQWALRLILHGDPPQVIPLTLNQLNQLRQPLDVGQEGGTLVIMPQTPFVDETAQYWLQVD